MDLAPTILYALNEAVPENMDGRILSDAFTPQYRESHPSSTGAAQPDDSGSPRENTGYSAEDEDAIRARLRDLGYVE